MFGFGKKKLTDELLEATIDQMEYKIKHQLTRKVYMYLAKQFLLGDMAPENVVRSLDDVYASTILDSLEQKRS